MPKLEWDKQGEHYFETGVENGVLYPYNEGKYSAGVAWNGLTAVNENATGAEPTALYADNIKYLNLISNEELEGTIEAYTYPDEFNACQGVVELAPGIVAGQQNHEMFGLAYKTKLGNDVKGDEYGYKLHLIYGCQARPTEKAYETINDSPEAITFSWEFSTTPVAVTGNKPTSVLTIDSTKTDDTILAAIEAILFGTEESDPRLPLPAEVLSLIASAETN
ncbi:MAG: hypothetical protein LUD27_04825 [Clostridia bacterium]|nr:hypothetical protein [Clostridia bacterium]